jgi:hypothetical protein
MRERGERREEREGNKQYVNEWVFLIHISGSSHWHPSESLGATYFSIIPEANNGAGYLP